jgi:hypothetical protein
MTRLRASSCSRGSTALTGSRARPAALTNRPGSLKSYSRSLPLRRPSHHLLKCQPRRWKLAATFRK